MKLWPALVLMLAAGAAQAQPIWRCGSEGRSYSDTPCRAGHTVEVTEARPAADLASAQQHAAREKALAAQLVRERQAMQASQATGAAGIHGSRLAANEDTLRREPQALSKSKSRPEEAGIWRATAPSSRHVKD